MGEQIALNPAREVTDRQDLELITAGIARIKAPEQNKNCFVVYIHFSFHLQSFKPDYGAAFI